MERVVRNTSANLRVTFYSDEAPVDADGAVTVTVTKADGSALVAGAATTKVADTTGVYQWANPVQPNLNHLGLAWTGTFSGVVQTIYTGAEIVGGFYVALAAIRNQPNVGAPFKWTTQDLVEARAWFEDTFEEYTGVSWVPRFARERHSGGRSQLLLNRYPVRSILSVRSYTSATAYTSFTADELADIDVSGPTIERLYLGTFPSGNRNIVVEYEHGFERPFEDIRRAALVGIREGLLTNKVGTRQFHIQTEQGIVREATASADFPFGVPFVDSVANRYRKYRVPSVA